MARYCFHAIKGRSEDNLRIVRKHFSSLDTKIEKVGEDGFCVSLKDSREKGSFTSLTDQIGMMDNFTHPVYTPRWKSIDQQGPYFIEEAPPLAYLIKKSNDKRYKLTPEANLVAFQYGKRLVAELPIDQVFKDNFWADFKTYLGPNQPFSSLDEISFSDVVKKVKEYNKQLVGPSVSSIHKYAIVDGEQVPLFPYTVEPVSIYYGSSNDPNRGRVKRAIEPADVSLNISPEFASPDDGFNHVYVPGASWAAKWRDPISGDVKYVSLAFEEPYTDFPSSSVSEREFVDDEDEDAKSDVDYGSLSEGDEDPVALVLLGRASGEIVGEERARKPKKGELRIAQKIVVDDEDVPDFEDLDTEELNLPFSYVIPLLEQWEIVLRACRSGFREVSQLDKVSNKVMMLVGDMSRMALASSRSPDKFINQEIVRYVAKRM